MKKRQVFYFGFVIALVLMAALVPGAPSAASSAASDGAARPDLLELPPLTGGEAPLSRLTDGRCCTLPFWTPDSEMVLYIDKPAPEAAVGIYGVDAEQPDAPRLVSDEISYFSKDMSLRIVLGDGVTHIERVAADGARWKVPADGRMAYISPENRRIAWERAKRYYPPEARVTSLWVANLDGSDAHAVATVYRGTIGDWISEDTLLVAGRESLKSPVQSLYAVSVSTGEVRELAGAEQLRGEELSPDGVWVAYLVAPNRDASVAGLWLARTDGSERYRVRPELFGAYHWRDHSRLLIIPFQPESLGQEVWELHAPSRQARQLTDSATTQFKITNGDWSVSPDGSQIAFVSAGDRNIWVMKLPE